MPDNAEPKIAIKKAMLVKAVKALQQVIAKRSANTNALFEHTSETVILSFTLSTIPEKRVYKPVWISLPHPMYNEKSEVCFFSKDPQKDYKEMLLRKHKVPGVTKVMGYSKLKKKYSTYELRRNLADAFDFFLCDKEVVTKVVPYLGIIFTKKKRKEALPVKVDRTLEDPTLEIRKALNGTPLRIPTGPCISVKVGRASMPEEHLIANSSSIIANTIRHLANIGNPVQSISLTATEAPALPIWKRPRPPGELVDLKKYHSDAVSSAASETGVSGTSETEGTSDVLSDRAETLSTKDSISEVGTCLETLSELDSLGDMSQSELDSEAGDTNEDKPKRREDMPLIKGLKKAKRKRVAAQIETEDAAGAVAAAPERETPAADTMKPPAVPAKKKKRAKQA